MSNFPHISVLLPECVAAFEGLEMGVFVDGTLGAGGHSEAILNAHPEIQTLIGIDQDKSALLLAKKRIGERLQEVHGNFSDLSSILKKEKISTVDGILVDLGVSSMQLDIADRGFSFMREGPLDMRMNPDAFLSAKEIVNTWEEKELADLFYRYGEERQSRKAAKAIVLHRMNKSFETTTELAALLEKVLIRIKWDQHPATKIFQAIRIAVNSELDSLEKLIPDAINALRKGGRLAVITFHSLEDRIVKHRFAYYASDKESTSGIGGMFLSKEPTIKILTRKPIEPSDEEVKKNPRSRSAKLRILEKL